ncbi:hypothetical protein [uncultured Eubacterium sp.]|uniref:hypothetical protein n=1 Tax=uncultured Eubacterium sp. TaxID=165185 RepID=UPI0025F4F95E|nr:hypothetical protein [uncultured Eubacterium sp.]
MAIKGSSSVTLVDLSDAYSVTLTSEAYTFQGNTTGAPAGLSCTTEIVSYCGNTLRKSSITASNITCPTGISATVSNNNTVSPTVTFKTTATLTGSCEAIIPVVVDGITINKKFSFAVAKTGATGAAGRGIKSTSITYLTGSSAISAPTGTWLATPPQTDPSKPYLWTRTIVSYTDNSSSTSYSVGSSIDGIAVGGRNLLKNSNTIYLIGSDYPSNTKRENGKITLLDNVKFNAHTWVENKMSETPAEIVRKIGETYTASVEVKTTNLTQEGVKFSCDFRSVDYKIAFFSETKIKANMNGKWQKISVSFTIPQTSLDVTKSLYNIFATVAVNKGTIIEYRNFKLEKGNKATDWIPAPEDQVNKGDVTNQLNSELKITGNSIDLTTGHFTVDSTNLQITSDGTLKCTNGVFGGEVKAKTVKIGSTDLTHVSNGNLGLTSTTMVLNGESAIIKQYYDAEDGGAGGSYYDMAYMGTVGGSVDGSGNHAQAVMRCEGYRRSSASGDLRLGTSFVHVDPDSAKIYSESNVDIESGKITINGTNWDTFKSQHGYDWSTFNTANTTGTWVPVMNGSKVNHRVIPADAFSASASGIFRKYGKVVVANFYGTSTSSLPWVPVGWHPVADISVPVTVVYSGNPYMAYVIIRTTGKIECTYYNYGSNKGTPASGSTVYGTATWITS